MKKFQIKFVLWTIGLVAVAWANYAVLTHFHPLDYYYTPAGVLLSAVVSSVEALILMPLSIKVWATDSKTDKDENLARKESIISEFKDD